MNTGTNLSTSGRPPVYELRDKEYLERQLRQRGSIEAVAEYLRCHLETVRKYMHAHGISPPPGSRSSSIRQRKDVARRICANQQLHHRQYPAGRYWQNKARSVARLLQQGKAPADIASLTRTSEEFIGEVKASSFLRALYHAWGEVLLSVDEVEKLAHQMVLDGFDARCIRRILERPVLQWEVRYKVEI